MRLIVTGASGFLGGAVASVLRDAGVDCVGVARRPSDGGVIVVRSYEDTPQGDVLVHLAESADRRKAAEAGDAYEADRASVSSALLANGYSRIVYASSGVLCGDSLLRPCRPEDPPIVDDVYSRVKYNTERALLAAGGVVARLGNVFGPGMSGDNVLSTILRQIPGAGPVRVRDASPVRDYVWIADAAAALAAMALSAPAGIFNVGTGRGTSVRELIRMALEIAGESDREIQETAPSHRYSRIVLDITATTTAFEWLPKTSLRDGLTALVQPVSA